MKNKKIKNLKKNGVILTIILAVIFGLAAGVVGQLITRSYISEDIYIPFWGGVNLTDNNYSGTNLIIRDAKKVIVEQNTKVIETINSVDNSIIGIFKKIPSPLKEDESEELEFDLDNYYKLNQEIGLGLIITSDGWIITNAFIVNVSLANILNDYVIITKDKKVYNIDKVVKDTITSFYFIHAEKAKDFPVRQFSAGSDISNGQLVLAIDWQGKSLLTSIVGLKENSVFLKFSDSFSDELILADNLSRAIIFDLSGNVVGLTEREGRIRPTKHFIGAIKSLLKRKEINRGSLGVNYVDLSVLAVDLAENKYKKGAFIYKNIDGIDIIKGSAADLAGLQTGDIIIQVDNIEINKVNTLTDVIQNYLAGEKVNIQYLREGAKKEVEVELGEIK